MAQGDPASPPSGALFVRQSGAGRPLVLLHGLLVSGEMFDPLVDALTARHRLLVPDLRGHGRSAGLPGPYPVARLAADIADVLDRFDVPRADVLGYSQGGAVAQQFARDHPHRVPRRHAEMLADGIPTAELCAVEDAGHLLVWTHTARFAAIVETWLAAG